MSGGMDRFLKGVQFIEDHLDRAVTLREIAAAAHYSEFHFARMFSALTGDSVMRYVMRRRLTAAAWRLRSGADCRLIDLAMDCGFSSQAAFTRAFKAQFAVTPGQFRKLPNPIPLQHRTPITKESLMHLKDRMTPEPRIVALDGFRIAGLKQHLAQGQNQDIPDLWGRLMAMAPGFKNVELGEAYGVCANTDATTGEFDYYAAVKVTGASKVPPELEHLDIPAQTYAVFTHKVKNPNLSQDLPPTFQYIWGTWLPNSGYDHAGGPDFEFYDARFTPNGPNGPAGEIDIYVPVKERG